MKLTKKTVKEVFTMSNWKTEEEQIAYYKEIAKMTPKERGQLVELLHNADKISELLK